MESVTLEDAKSLAREVLLDRVVLAIFATAIILYSWLNAGDLVPWMSATDRFLIMVAWVGATYLFMFAVAPWAITKGVNKSIPTFWILWFLLLLVAVIEYAVNAHILAPETTLLQGLHYNFASVATFTAGLLLVCYICRQRFEHYLKHDPINTIFTFPLKLKINKISEQFLTGDTGEIIEILAQNQYVKVSTTNKSHLIRMSLKEAVSLLPDDSGWIVHRSRWMAKSRLKGLVYRRGNPFVVADNDDEYPASRAMIPTLKKYLEER